MNKARNKTYPEIREIISDNDLTYYQVAHEIGINASTFMRWLQAGNMTSIREKRVHYAMRDIIERKRILAAEK